MASRLPRKKTHVALRLIVTPTELVRSLINTPGWYWGVTLIILPTKPPGAVTIKAESIPALRDSKLFVATSRHCVPGSDEYFA